jgi:hypothetical protein
MKLYKNIIKKEYSNKINEELLKPYFPWYYNKNQNNKDTSYMFHLFFNGTNVNSDYFYLVEPILKKLKIKNLLNVRANLCLKRPSKCNWHVDKFTKNLKHKTAIYYVNTNNGYTLFKNKKVKCEKNKIVIFDADQKHKAKIQTNTDARIVININYEFI